KGSERLTGIGRMMWERENASLLLQHLSHMQSERGRCSIRSANLGPGLARPGPFSSVSSWPPPTVSCYRTCAADRTAARQWQRRTNVWRKVTSPARGPKRPRSGTANERLAIRRLGRPRPRRLPDEKAYEALAVAAMSLAMLAPA